MGKSFVALLINLCMQVVSSETVEDKLDKRPDPTGTGHTPPYAFLHALTREYDHLHHLADVQSTFWPEMGTGTMCGGRGKWRKGLVLAQHMGGNVTQMAHRTVQYHSREVSLPRNSFSSKKHRYLQTNASCGNVPVSTHS